MNDVDTDLVVDAVDQVAVGDFVKNCVKIVELWVAVRRQSQWLEIFLARTDFNTYWPTLEFALYLFLLGYLEVFFA